MTCIPIAIWPRDQRVKVPAASAPVPGVYQTASSNQSVMGCLAFMGSASPNTNKVTRTLMAFLAIGIVSIPLVENIVRSSLSSQAPPVWSLVLGLLVLVLGTALLILGFVVRRNIHELAREKNQLQTLFESLAEGVVIFDSRGLIVQCNAQAESILGLGRAQLLSSEMAAWHLIKEDGTPWPLADNPALVTLQTGQSIREALMGLRGPGGDLKWLKVNTQAVQDRKGSAAMVVVSFTDVTSTRQQMDRLDLTISGAGLGTWDWNIVTGQVVFNDIWAHMLGYDLSEVAPDVSSWEKSVDPDAGGQVMAALNEHLAGRTPIYRSEHRLRRKDGSWMWVLDTGRVVERDSDGQPLRALGVHVDITLTKQMEQRLRESDQRFLAIFDQTAHLLWFLSPDGLIHNANQAALNFAQAKLIGLIGRHFSEAAWLSRSRDQQITMQLAIERAAAGEFVRFELEIYPAGQSRARTPECTFDFSIKPVCNEHGVVTSLVAEALDISGAVRNRQVLHVAQERLVQATRNANLGVWDWNPTTDEAWFSEQWYSMLGYTEHDLPSVGSTWMALLHPADLDAATAALSRYLRGEVPSQKADEEAQFRLEFRMRRADGTFGWVLSVGRVTERDEDGRPMRVSGVHFDETERKRMQSQRSQTQRLESIGQLAAGVAHEINTPMQFVSDNLEYLVEGIESADRLIDDLQNLITQANDGTPNLAATTIRADWLPRAMKATGYERFRKESAGAVRDCRDGCQRVVTIVHAMRQLSHPGTDSFQLANLNEVINGATIVTRNRWKFVADVHLELADDLPCVPCRAAELSQVIVNMIVNSADAMAETEPGTSEPSGLITIRTWLGDDEVHISVHDNGSGIPQSVLDRVFDPFFTTKPVGKGTGQGLAIAHDIIVNRHHGNLRAESEPGRGTTFYIELPLHQESEESQLSFLE